MSEGVQIALYLRLLMLCSDCVRVPAMRCLPMRSTYAKSIRMWSTRFASTFHVINFDEINQSEINGHSGQRLARKRLCRVKTLSMMSTQYLSYPVSVFVDVFDEYSVPVK